VLHSSPNFTYNPVPAHLFEHSEACYIPRPTLRKTLCLHTCSATCVVPKSHSIALQKFRVSFHPPPLPTRLQNCETPKASACVNVRIDGKLEWEEKGTLSCCRSLAGIQRGSTVAGGKPVGHTAKPLLSVKFYLADNEIMKCRLL